MRVLEHNPPEMLTVPENEPVIFLAGPIQGTQDWQKTAISYLQNGTLQNTPYFPAETVTHVANPRRDYLPGDFDYDKQVEWEEESLWRATKFGAVIIWLEAQDDSLDYEAGRAFAQTTRFEFGAVVQGWKRLIPQIQVSMGIDPNYKGGNERYYRTKAEKFNVPVFDSLQKVCIDASAKTIVQEIRKV